MVNDASSSYAVGASSSTPTTTSATTTGGGGSISTAKAHDDTEYTAAIIGRRRSRWINVARLSDLKSHARWSLVLRSVPEGGSSSGASPRNGSSGTSTITTTTSSNGLQHHQHLVRYKRLLIFRLTPPPPTSTSTSSTLTPSAGGDSAAAAAYDLTHDNSHTNDEQLYCMEATCPHLGAPLSHAQVLDNGSSSASASASSRHPGDDGSTNGNVGHDGISASSSSAASPMDIEDLLYEDGTSENPSGACSSGGPTIVCPWHLYDFDLTSGESSTGMKLCTYPVRLQQDGEHGGGGKDREVFVGVEEEDEEQQRNTGWEVAELKAISEAFGASNAKEVPGAAAAAASSSSSSIPPPLPNTLISAALLILQTADPVHKVELTRQAAVALRTGQGFTSIRPTRGDVKRSEALFGKHGRPPGEGVQIRPPEPGSEEDRRVSLVGDQVPHFVPGRHVELVVDAEATRAAANERRGRAGSARNRAAMLHALAAIEQWAIDLAWDCVARFGDIRVPNTHTGELDAMPSEFFIDFARMAEDEAKHFSLLSQRLDALGVPFGSLPAHAGLWDSAIETSRSLLSRLAVIHLVAEARGLDVNPLTIEKFRRAGDGPSVESLEIIHADEVTHVTTGHRWFVWICERMGLDPIETFRAEVKANFGGKVSGPFNKEDRRKAGMTEAYYEGIEGGKGSQQYGHLKSHKQQQQQDVPSPAQTVPIVAPTPSQPPANVDDASPTLSASAALPQHPSPVPFPASSEILPSTVPEDANDHCPGVESTDAGKADACEGCPNQSTCAEGPKGPDPDLPFIRERMSSVRRKILVLSGKGGVGKSTFSAGLSWALAADEELQTGVMDVDVCGPSIPLLMGLEGATIHTSASGWSPAYARENLAVMSIGFMLPSKSDAVIWRGPRKNGLIKQFLKDVEWGDLDYLVVDTPPGTSDEHLSIVQFLQEAGIDGAVLVTTPQEVALQDVRKEADFCRKVGLRVLGVVENMSGFVCPSCKETSDIFAPTTGGAERMAQELGLELLGKVPLDPRIGASCDRGESFLDEYPDSPATGAYLDIVQRIRELLGDD